MIEDLLTRRWARWRRLVERVGALAATFEPLDDEQLRKASLSLQYRAKAGEALDDLLPEAYALMREAARRTIRMRHFDVQILGGIALHHRCIAEMQTGEGKTLTAILPCYLHALLGRGVHVATVNDYLAKRDAQWMAPAYELLGMRVGFIQSQMPPAQRREAYACDVTYGTAKEFGFDFLRDRLLLRRIREGHVDVLGGMLGQRGPAAEQPVQRDAYFALVDEADSILIDEARTPLIISALPTEEQKLEVACYQWAAQVAGQFTEKQHYQFDHDERRVTLSAEGRQLARRLEKPDSLDRVGMFTIYEFLERAIKVRREFIRDRHFVIRQGEVVIVDEFTGRLAEGRKWRDGIHQAVEAQEGVSVTVNTGQAARVTVQDYFLRYQRLAGMTGTAATSARELRRIYGVRVVTIPTNRPTQRRQLPDRVFGTAEAKWQAVVEEVQEVHRQGRPVLIGTRSIDKSELLSRLLTQAGIPHQVLNARHVAAEAEIVKLAGQAGRVTVSTNMAGRGTDIQLGPGVAELGGLHVIATELHDAARIDRQLAGRSGRQGDPGTVRQYMALDDELLLSAFGPKRAERLKQLGRRAAGSLDHLARLFRKAQRRIEARHFRERKILMYYERQRHKMHRQMGQDPYLDAAG